MVEKAGIKVTAADYNGETWDGAPLVPTRISREVFEKLLSNGDIVIRPNTDTDYSLWNVKTKSGICVAGPGDFISVADDLSLIVYIS